VWLEIYGSKGDLVLSIFELLFDEGNKSVEFMIPPPKVPTVDAN
jgi:hypothetical protein